jgi:hypothetical protein
MDSMLRIIALGLMWGSAPILMGCTESEDKDTDTDTDSDTDTDCSEAPQWMWPSDDQGELLASNVAGGQISVVTSDATGTSTLFILNAETGEVVEEHTLTGDSAPELPFVGGEDPDVRTAAFVARDADGRTYVLHTPSEGGGTTIPSMVYRYDADGSKAFTAALPDRGHGSLQIEPDGQGGALVAVWDDPVGLMQVIRIGSDGDVVWELGSPDERLLYGFALDGDSLWVTHASSWSTVSLATGETISETEIIEPPEYFITHRAAPGPDGDLYLLGCPDDYGEKTLLRVGSGGGIVWSADLGDEGTGYTPWALDLDVLEGAGVCTGTSLEPNSDGTQRQMLHCFDTSGQLVEEMGPVSNLVGGIDLDAEGNLYTTDLAPHRVVVRYCPF